MIGLLTGTPKLEANQLIILVGGVGYLVHVGSSVLSTVAQRTEVTLFIHTHVREQAIELFGFSSAEAKKLFLLLMDVSGVGPKTALAIADAGSDNIVEAVQKANVTFFTKIPRVGKKLAQKIIIELKSKLGSLEELNIGGMGEDEQLIFDAVLALGFSEYDVQQALRTVPITELSPEASIKAVLKQLQK